MRNSTVIGFPPAKTRPIRSSKDTLKAEMEFDAGYRMPDRLSLTESPIGREADVDLQDVRKRAITRLKQVISKPEAKSKLIAAFQGPASSPSANAQSVVKTLLQRLTQVETASFEDSFPRFVLAKSMPQSSLLTSEDATVLPMPVAMAYVRRPNDPDKVTLSSKLGYRDMQIQSQSIAAMVLLETAKDGGAISDAPQALQRLNAFVEGRQFDPSVSSIATRKPIQVKMDHALHVIPAELYRIDTVQ